MSGNSNGGAFFVLVILVLIVLGALIQFWYLALMLLGLLGVLYAHYLNSHWAGNRLKWTVRFGLLASAVYISGALGFYYIPPQLLMPSKAIVGFGGILFAVHVAGWIICLFLNMIYNFVTEDRSPRREQPRAKAQEQKQEKKQEQRQHTRSEETFSGAFNTEKQALDFFELSKPYTLDELKKRRMDLLKKVHPDQGGSNMMARMVNEAYELLKSRV